MSFSAENVWNPLYNDFEANSASWDSVFNTVNSFSACWQSTYTTVKTLSTAWLSPISIVYPGVFGDATEYNGTTNDSFVSWVNSSFPVSQGGCINYLDGQRLKLFSLGRSYSNQTITGKLYVSETISEPTYVSRRVIWVSESIDTIS